MARQLTGKVVLATHNSGKLHELQQMMAPYGVELVSAGQLGLPEPEETGTSFIENAMIKARAAMQATNLPCIADDSGICIDALGGAPGVYTADWAGEPRNWDVAMRRAHDELLAVGAILPDSRHARFISMIVILWPDDHSEVFEGSVSGELVWPTRGTHGHGYDPMFQPDGSPYTFAQMSESEKNAISHRGRAFRLMAETCLGAPRDL